MTIGRRTDPNFRQLWYIMKGQGRSFAWLAKRTGFSAKHLSAVARGERAGSQAFYRSVSMALGQDVLP